MTLLGTYGIGQKHWGIYKDQECTPDIFGQIYIWRTVASIIKAYPSNVYDTHWKWGSGWVLWSSF